MNNLSSMPVARVMLPDTLGIARPDELQKYFVQMKKKLAADAYGFSRT